MSITVIGGSWRTARKKHICACGKRIRPGDRYYREVSKVDGDFEVRLEGYHIHSFEEAEAAEDRYWDGKIAERLGK